MTDANQRQSEYPIDPLFLERWSPRAFTDDMISEQDLLTMIEAGCWAASSYNVQPWRFLYARRGTPYWQSFLDLLVPTNQAWAKNAAALVIVVSDTKSQAPGSSERKPNYTHTLDAGAATAQFALQATQMGWQVHGMAGVDRDRAIQDLKIPADYRVEAAYAVGKQGDKAMLVADLQSREQPSKRRAVIESAFEGTFRAI